MLFVATVLRKIGILALRFVFGLTVLSHVICVLKGYFAWHHSKYMTVTVFGLWYRCSHLHYSVCKVVKPTWGPFIQVFPSRGCYTLSC